MTTTIKMSTVTGPAHPAGPVTPDPVGPAVTPGPVGPAVTLPGGPGGAVTLIPVHRDGRAVGAYLVGDGAVRYRPVVDVDQVLGAALAALAVTAAATAVIAGRRRSPAIGAVTMGPGGWISLKGVSSPALRATRRARREAGRPWWARLLRARRLVVER
nr:hypothetical protein [Micromonospora sp. DSM 115978]